MRRALGFSGFVRFLSTFTLGAAGVVALLSCSETPTSPTADSKAILADGSFAYVYHYPDSVRYGPASGWVSVSSNQVVDNALTPDKPAFAVAVPPSTYNVTSVTYSPEAPVPTTAGLGPTNDFSVKPNVPIGFTFNFYGNAYTTVNISSSGLVQFGNPQTKDGCCWGWFIARNDQINNVIAVGWSAWTASAVSRPIRYELRGSAPNRRFVIQYFNIPEDGGGGRLNAQLILYERTNDIVLYTTQLNTTISRHSITQGLENNIGTEASFVAGRDSARFSISNDGVKFALNAVNTAPVITQPADLSLNTDASVCVSSFSVPAPSFTDDAAGARIDGVRSDNLALSAAYPKGTTTITWTATDVEGLKSSVTQTVTVSDKEKPLLSPVQDVALRTDPGVSFASVNLVAPSVTADNCGDAQVSGVRSDNANFANKSFPIGVTTVTWTAKDLAGNSSSVSQTVTVTGNVAPTIIAPPNKLVFTDARACVATVDVGTATFKDDLAGASLVAVREDGQALNAPYRKGLTRITWTVTDVDQATASAIQTVTVNDNEAPVMSAPENISVRQDRGEAHASVAVAAPSLTQDNCGDASVNGVRSDNAPMNAVFPVGVTTIAWTALDASGNKVSVAQTVTVVGNKPPVIMAPANIEAGTDARACFATVHVATPTFTDDIAGASIDGKRSDGQALSAVYPKGATTIIWTATDYDYATASVSQTVTVSDKENPSVVAPADQLDVATDAGRAYATLAVGAATADDNCHQVSVNGSRSDGAALNAPYPLGTTRIVWTASDPSGNNASASQTIVVKDKEAPYLVVPSDFSVNATMPSGAVVTYTLTATDNVGVTSVSCDHASGTLFPIGYTTITCVARDAAGNSTSHEFGVEVMDAHDQLVNLIEYVRSLGLSNGVENPLVNQLRAADRDGADPQACTKLDDFVHMVSVKDGSLTIEWSTHMRQEARRIQAVLGCAGVAGSANRVSLTRSGMVFNRNPGR